MQKTRKLIAMLLAVMMVLSMCTVGMFSASALPEDAVISDTEGNDASSIDGELYGLMGDSDSNGKINVKDATQIQKFAAKLIELDETSAALADVDLNGKVNVKDATAIQKWVAKIPVDAPINCLVYIPTAEPTTVATEPTTIVVVPTTAATEDETVPVIIPTLVTEPTEAPTTVEPTEAPTTVEPTEAPTTEAKPTEAPTTEAKPTEAPTTEAKPTEAPTTVKPTDAPEGDVIVYFQNNWMWSDVSAYAWNDDGAISKWPGEAMTFVENDGNYDIYSYVVPAGAKGILFNGTKDTDPTTRDQTPNIEEWTNGQCFYMVWDETANEGEGGNGVGSFPYVAPTEPATETTVAPETTVASDTDPTETTAADTKPTETEPTETTEATTVAPETIGAGYYLVGIIGGEELWDADTLTADRKFKANPDVAGDYVLYWTTIGGDEYKVAYFDGTAITKLFKAEGEDNYKIGKTSDKIGYCKIDFNPEGKSTSVWSYKYFTVKTTTPPVTQPTDAPETQATTVAPESKPQLTESDYELRGSFNDWNGQAMYIAEEDGVVTLTLELAAGEYTFKIKKGDTWYGNDGKIEDTTKKTSQGGWEMSSSAGDCTLIASGGTYTFNFNTSTKKLNVLYSTEPVTEPTEATTVAPETSTAAPETSTAAPETSTVAPETSTAAPETSTAAPETSTAAPETSTVAPETSTAAPETSTAAPETSTVAPETDPTETTTEADGLEAGYYLVGIIDGKECWKADTLVAERKFAEATGGDYVLYWTTVMDDEYKVAYFDGTEITKLFKAEGEPNYTIGTEKKVGYCKIDFNPDGKDTSVWSYKYFTVNAVEAPETEPTETTTVAPETETTEPTTPDVETVVITFNAAKTTWVSSAGAKLVLVDNDTNKEYPMTGSGNVWTVEVPVTVTNITFNRNDPSTNKPWNFWVAGDRADAVKYNTLGDGAGSWEGVAAPEWYVRGSFNSWGTANPMKTTDGVTYTCEITLAKGNYEFKVGNVDWSSAYPGSNKSLNVTTAGTYLFTFNASSKTVTAVLK